MNARSRLDFIVPAAVVVLFAALGVTGVMDPLEQKVYDALLHVKPAVPESPSILFLDVDDLGISRVGVWPWSRDVMADGLILMRELGAAYAVFDIEYLNASPSGLDTFTLRRTVPDTFNQEFSRIQTNIEALLSAISAGNIPAKDAARYAKDLEDLTAKGKGTLLETVKSVERDNDAYLGQAARFFGSLYLTVAAPPTPDEGAPPELVRYAMDSLSLKNVSVEADPLNAAASLNPAILAVIQGAAGAGFPNVVVDGDGVRRRIDLIKSFQGAYFAQLAFRPLLALLGDPRIVLKRHAILLEGADVPGKGKRDITIPLSADGTFLINWAPERFIDSFRHLSFYELVYHRLMEEDLVYNLDLMDQNGYLSYASGETGPLAIYAYAEQLKKEMLEGGDLSGMRDYVTAREAFFTEAGSFLNGGAEKAIIADLDKALSARGLTADQRAGIQEVKAQVPEIFKSTRGVYEDLIKTRQILKRNLPGSFVIVGITATSTTDIGVNPFDNKYTNVGTHASVVNTILQEKFLNQLPWWYGALLSLILAFAVTFVILRLDAVRTTIVGAAVVVALIVCLAGCFLLTGVYVDTVTPVASVFFTIVALTAVKFLRTEREKSFVRNTFAHYLSTEVISDLLSNPEKLKLGGDKKVLTAMFTDVRGFSTISEVLDPTDLVRLLNLYLSEMSDIILDLRGTLDKYEGDAIMSFFGAPVDLADHARRACLAAVRMKRAEITLNERFLSEKLAPTSLHTRIGINSGEMVVGNMGTQRRMDYTIMGSSVNLASRLEGVNKQYGTWILVSEFTQSACGDDFLMRRLDRVRVVGINRPVRLYELIEEKGRADGKVEQATGLFHQGLDLLEAREWRTAEAQFAEVLRLIPDDGPSKAFIKRCQEYQAKPPAEGWDGVFNLTVK